GVDRSHNTEFTMMECYMAYADYRDVMDLVEDLFRTIAIQVHGTTRVEYQGQIIDFGPKWTRLSIPESIKAETGIDIMEITELQDLQAAIREKRLRVENKPSWAKQVDELFSECVQPKI